MATISLKISNELPKTSDRCADSLNLSRAGYIRRAIKRMNSDTCKRLRAKRLTTVSQKVRQESMRVNAEFEAIEHDPDA